MTEPQEKLESESLILGWQVTPTLGPRYWLDATVKAGQHSEHHLVKVPADSIACHTAIVAQSGSGKSFFLGRLVEELILRTKARCVILDPNADFRRVSEVVEEGRWKCAHYNNITGLGFLPHEACRDEFALPWLAVTKSVLSGQQMAGENYEQLRLPWASLSVEFLADDVAPMLRSDLYHCHEFVKAIANLLNIKYLALDQRLSRRQRQSASESANTEEGQEVELIEESRTLLTRARFGDAEYRRNLFAQEFGINAVRSDRLSASTSNRVPWPPSFWRRFSSAHLREQVILREVERAVAAIEYISPEVERYYFGKASEYTAQGLVETKVGPQLADSKLESRITVIDLPSFPDPKTRFLALNSVLSGEWERARNAWAEAIERPENEDERVPTFIILDEAHNLVPTEPRNLAAEALREQFRTIAAEGRKYGLFLILCTQRPDKIDPLVLSECENGAIMRLGSRSVLEDTKRLLGLEDVDPTMLSKCLEFELGRTLLIGRWAKPGPQLLYGAMRRTVEGGRNLRAQHWAHPQQFGGVGEECCSEGADSGDPMEAPERTASQGEEVGSSPGG